MATFFDNFPAGSPPSGITSNFINPPTRVPAIITVEGVFVPLMLIFLSVRFYVRITVTKSWGLDDYTCLIAACGSIAHMVNHTQMFAVGLGRHLWDIRASTLIDPHNSRILGANTIAYPITIFFGKISILLLYLRVFKVDKTLRHLIYPGIVFHILFYSTFLGLGIGELIACYGLSQLSKVYCINMSGPVILMAASVNVMTDFYILALPMNRIRTLQVRLKYKIGLLIVFSAGFAACAASLARLIVFSTHFHDPDILWLQGLIAQLTVVEINIIIIVACTSTFPAFFTKIKGFGSTAYSSLRARILNSRFANSQSRIASHPSQKINESKSELKDGPTNHSDQYGDKVKLHHIPGLTSIP